jgi:hypothetical protein
MPFTPLLGFLLFLPSSETWEKDLKERPARYAQMGVQEYFAYDPNDPLIIRGSTRRLYGWRFDAGRHVMREIPTGQNGAMWSEQLESWLLPDGAFLRLYDRNWQPCLTEAESEARRAAIATSLAEIEAKRAANAIERAEAEARRAEAEARRARLLAEKLRSLGINDFYQSRSVMVASTRGPCHPERQRRISSVDQESGARWMRSFPFVPQGYGSRAQDDRAHPSSDSLRILIVKNH